MVLRNLFIVLALAGSIASTWTTTPARAADLWGPPNGGSVKDGPYVPPPFSWTGFYLGGNLGYAWSDADFRINPTGSWTSFPALSANIQESTNGTLTPDGFTGGVQMGFNQQVGNWLWGIEADINAVDGDDRRTGGAIAGTSIDSFSQRAEISWMATIRARLGLTMDRTLVYVTGGVAFADWDVNMRMAANGGEAVFRDSSVQTGWVIGGGLEYAFDNHWTLKGEYLYADFGDASGSSVFTSPPNAPNYTHDHKVDLTTQVLRLGLNYKF